MELGGLSHILQRKEVNYLKFLSSRNIKIILFDEKYIYDLLATEYQNSKVNEIFKFAVRAFNSKASIIHATFDAIPELNLPEFAPEGHNLTVDDICTIINWFMNCSCQNMGKFFSLSKDDLRTQIDMLQKVGY